MSIEKVVNYFRIISELLNNLLHVGVDAEG